MMNVDVKEYEKFKKWYQDHKKLKALATRERMGGTAIIDNRSMAEVGTESHWLGKAEYKICIRWYKQYKEWGALHV